MTTTSSRYAIGIDLGTTHSALSWVDLQAPQDNEAAPQILPIAQQSGPKVLRIGLVQGGKVIEERVIKQRTHVTVGPSEKSMFVLPTKSVPPNFKLFELVGNDYCINFLDGMGGRVALKTGISDLSALRGQARRVQQGPGGRSDRRLRPR